MFLSQTYIYTYIFQHYRCTFIMTLSTTCCLLMTLDVFIYSFVHFWIFIIIRFSFNNYNVFSQNRQGTLQLVHAQAHTKMSFGCHETNILTLMFQETQYHIYKDTTYTLNIYFNCFKLINAM